MCVNELSVALQFSLSEIFKMTSETGGVVVIRNIKSDEKTNKEANSNFNRNQSQHLISRNQKSAHNGVWSYAVELMFCHDLGFNQMGEKERKENWRVSGKMHGNWSFVNRSCARVLIEWKSDFQPASNASRQQTIYSLNAASCTQSWSEKVSLDICV